MTTLWPLVWVLLALFVLCGATAARMEYIATGKRAWRVVHVALVIALCALALWIGYTAAFL